MNSSQNGEEIFLIDIIRFLIKNFKLIIVFGVIGVFISMTYILVAPNKFQATAQIQMAQMKVAGTNSGLSWLNIEEPAALVGRLYSPSNLAPEVIVGCGFDTQDDVMALFMERVKITLPRGIPNIVELRVTGLSSEYVKTCTRVVFELIRSSQASLSSPYVEDAKSRLKDYQARLDSLQNFIASSNRSGQAISASYLSTRDEVAFLLTEISLLKNTVGSIQIGEARLMAPIYSSDKPVAIKKWIVLLIGFFGGSILGLLLAVGHRVLAKPRISFQKFF